jgi:hypothetical protein
MFFCDDKFDAVCKELLSRGWKRDLDTDDRVHKNATLIWTNLVGDNAVWSWAAAAVRCLIEFILWFIVTWFLQCRLTLISAVYLGAL